MNTPKPPAQSSDGLRHTLQPDGRVRFALAHHGKAVSHVVLAPSQASEVAVAALGAAVDAFDQAAMGLTPAYSEAKGSTAPFVRITGLGVGNCPIEDHVCLVVKAGAAEVGLALPRKKLMEFAQWVTANEKAIATNL